MFTKREQKKLQVERLETRQLLASDYALLTRLEAIDDRGKVIDNVQVGEAFRLRLTIEDGDPNDAIRHLNAFQSDLVFDSKYVEMAGAFQPNLSEPWDIRFENVAPGRLKSIEWTSSFRSREFMRNNPGWTPQVLPVVQWYLPMIAKSEGSTVLTLSQPDSPRPDMVSPSKTRYDFLRIRVGNAIASPWQNPKDPRDVNNDSQLDIRDYDMLQEFLAKRPKTLLDDSDIPSHRAPYFDVDGNRSIDAKDLEILRENFNRTELNPNLRFLRPNFEAGVRLVNLRSGSTVGDDIRVGDLIEIQTNKGFPDWLLNLNDLSSSFELMPLPSSSLSSAWEGAKYRIRAKSAGSTAIEFSINEAAMKHLRLSLPDLDPEQVRARLRELLPTMKRSATAREAINRPIAHADHYRYESLLDIRSAEQASQRLSNPGNWKMRRDAAQGLLNNDQYAGNAKVILVDGFSNLVSTVQVSEDGSFSLDAVYSPMWTLSVPTSFQYVVADQFGTSEIQTVTIEPIELPVADLIVEYLDGQGKLTNRVRVGDAFSVRFSVFINSMYVLPQTIETTSFGDMRIINRTFPMSFSYFIDETIASTLVAPSPNLLFGRTQIGLATDSSGSFQLKQFLDLPEIRREGDKNKFVADFLQHQAILPRDTSIAAVEHVLFAQKPGHLGLRVQDAYVQNAHLTHMKSAGSLNIRWSELEIYQEDHNYLLPSDVDDDQSVSPLDVLNLVNHLNEPNRPPEARVKRFYGDVDDDGEITPLDVLKVINEINASLNLSTSGEVDNSFDPIASQSDPTVGIVQYTPDGDFYRLSLKIREGSPRTAYPIHLEGRLLGTANTDARGRATFTVHCDGPAQSAIEQGARITIGNGMSWERNDADRLNFPASQSSTTPDNPFVPVDAFFVDFDQDDQVGLFDVMQIVNAIDLPSEHSGSPNTGSLDAVSRGTVAQFIYDPLSSDRLLTISLRHGKPLTSYTVALATVSIGEITTDEKGRGEIKIAANESLHRQLIDGGMMIQIGDSIQGQLFERADDSGKITWNHVQYKLQGVSITAEYKIDQARTPKGSLARSQAPRERLRIKLSNGIPGRNYDVYMGASHMGILKTDNQGTAVTHWTSHPSHDENLLLSLHSLSGSSLLKRYY